MGHHCNDVIQNNFQTFFSTGWHNNWQPIRSRIRKFLLTNTFYSVILALFSQYFLGCHKMLALGTYIGTHTRTYIILPSILGLWDRAVLNEWILTWRKNAGKNNNNIPLTNSIILKKCHWLQCCPQAPVVDDFTSYCCVTHRLLSWKCLEIVILEISMLPFSNLLATKIQRTTLWLPKATSPLLPLFHLTTGCENVGFGNNLSRAVCSTEWTQRATKTTKNREIGWIQCTPHMYIAYTKVAFCNWYHMDYHDTR